MHKNYINNKKRDLTLDVMKTLLVIGMITAHVFQLCYMGNNKMISLFSLFMNIITFSSFMFVFGCSSQIAYFNRYKERNSVKTKLLKNFVKLIICFYISGFAYLFLVDNEVSLYEIAKVAFLWRVPGYSEFLLSFAFINVIIYILYNILRDINFKKVIPIILFSYLLTFIPYNMIKIPLMGTFIGSTKFSCFPILQYFSFFIVGMYCKKNSIFFNKQIWIAAFILTFSSFLIMIYTHKIPQRFPPSLQWITLSPFFVLLYYMLSYRIGEYIMNKKIRIIVDVFGAYTLDYLVLSNIIIFLLRKIFYNCTNITLLLVTSSIILILCFLYGRKKYIIKNIEIQ